MDAISQSFPALRIYVRLIVANAQSLLVGYAPPIPPSEPISEPV